MLLNDLATACRGSGLTVHESPGWTRRNHGQMTAVKGVICHHTGSSGSGAENVVRDGRTGLAGPLAQLTLRRDGSVGVLANGQAWHAGTGSWPSIGRNNGNAYCIGIEAVYNGSDITAAQRDAYPRLVAALCRHYRVPVGNVIGHREWAPGRKVDPGQIDMAAFRRAVQSLVSGTAPAPVTPAPTPQKKALPTMIDRSFDKFTGVRTGRIICPVGPSSALVGRAWFSCSFDGGVRVEAWFQKAAPGSDGAAPGTGPAIDWTLKNAERGVVEIPGGTEFIQYRLSNPEGAGAICIEMAPK